MKLKNYSKRVFKTHLLLLFFFTLFTYPISFMKLEIFNRSLPIYIIVLFVLFFVTVIDWRPIAFGSLLKVTKVIWIFFCVILITAVISIYHDEPQINLALIALTYTLIPIVLSENIKNERMLESIICTFAVALAVMVVFGYYGFLTHKTGHINEHRLFYWGIRYTPATRNSDVLFPILLVLFTFSLMGFKRLNLSIQIVFALIFVTSGTAVLLSQSRGGWLAFMAGMTYLVIQWYKRLKKKKVYYNVFLIYLFSIIAVISLIWLFNVIPESIKQLFYLRFRSIFNMSNDSIASNVERLRIIESAFVQIIHNPFGVGWGNAINYLNVEETAHHAENAYLNVLVETGWVGFGCFLYMVFYPLKQNWMYVKRKDRPMWYIVFLVSTNIMIAVYFLFNTAVYNICIWIIIGLNLCSVYIQRKFLA